MPSLRELQIQIQSAVISGQTPDSLSAIVREKPPITIKQRMYIYQNGYVARLLDSLREDFGPVETLLGEERFEELATLFVQNPLRRHWNIAEISEDFPVFLEKHSVPASFIAKQNWAAILNDQLEDYPMNLISLEDINQGASFHLHKHPRNTLWQHEGKNYLSFRKNDEVTYREVTVLEYEILQTAAKPLSLEKLSQKISAPESDLAQALTTLLGEGLLSTTKGNTHV